MLLMKVQLLESNHWLRRLLMDQSLIQGDFVGTFVKPEVIGKSNNPHHENRKMIHYTSGLARLKLTKTFE